MASPALTAESSASSQRMLSKDEIGYKFVKDYYTTLNQDPSLVHRFYKKQSTLTHGNEGGISETYVGQRAINDMIESFGFKDCAVILSSVDSMESMNGGIVIQVLGELSNNGAPSQKFAQTFFLASVPPSGYFVLNNIFRYLKEDIDSDFDDVEPDSANEMDTSVAHSNIGSNHLSNGYHSAPQAIVHEEEPSITTATPVSSGPAISSPDTQPELGLVTVVSEATGEQPLDDDTTKGRSTTAQPTPTATVQLSHEMQPTLEEPGHADDPAIIATQPIEPTPTVEPLRSATAPAGPVAKSWATMAATNFEKWRAQNSEQKITAPVAAPRTRGSGNPSVPRKDTAKASQQEKLEPALGYIKHVQAKVQKSALNDALIKFGTLKDLDINRQKSCGFVEFSTHAALQAAISAGPIDIGDNYKIVVEERRKSAKTDAKAGKQLTMDRKVGPKPDEARTGAKKLGRVGTGTGGHKPRTD